MRTRILLLDVDETLINFSESQKAGKAIWNGGSSAIWKQCIRALKEAALAVNARVECGLATYKHQKDMVSLAVEQELAEDLNPDHIYYDTERCENKVSFALESAAKSTLSKKDVCILDDQPSVSEDALGAGFSAICAITLLPLTKKNNFELRQQLAIVSFFEKALEKLELPRSATLAKLKREIAILIAVSEAKLLWLNKLLLEDVAPPALTAKDPKGFTALELAKAKGFTAGAVALTAVMAKEAAQAEMKEEEKQVQPKCASPRLFSAAAHNNEPKASIAAPASSLAFIKKRKRPSIFLPLEESPHLEESAKKHEKEKTLAIN